MPARWGQRAGKRRAPIGVIPAAPPAARGQPFPSGIKGHPRAELWGAGPPMCRRRPRPAPSEARGWQFFERRGSPKGAGQMPPNLAVVP